MNSLKLILSNPRYFAPAFVFASLNILLGTWVIYIPQVKARLQLDDGDLGVALFFYALGVMIMLPIIPLLTKKLGVGKATLYGLILFIAAFTMPLLAETYTVLCGALLITGAFSGGTDVAMNSLVSDLEKKDGVSFMSAAHGFFSLGGVIGAGIGGLIMHFFSMPVYHMIFMSSIVLIINLFLCRQYVNISGEHESSIKESLSVVKMSPLFGLAFIAFVIMGSEGAIEHWSKLYMLEVLDISSDQLAGYGFVIFSVAMTTGRFFGDGISDRFGSHRIISYGILLAAAGFGLILMVSYIVVIVGFGLVGLGLSVVIPELFRIAGQNNSVSASVARSFVSGLGFVGFLLGPVVLGYISDHANLHTSFIVLLGLTILAAISSMIISRKDKLVM